MKRLASVFLLLAFCKVVVGIPGPCPPDSQIKPFCDCYNATGYMSCTNINRTWLQIFNSTVFHKLNTLVISDSPDLPLLTDHIKNSNAGISAKTLIFSLKSKLNTPSNNVNALVKMAQEALEINYPDLTNKLNIDAELLNIKLRALTLSNVKVNNLSNLKQKEMKFLRNLKLNKISLDTPDLRQVKISLPALTRLEITKCDELKVPFQYIPTKCSPDQQIELILQDNKNLVDFDMTKMFDDPNCNYYVDLSGSKLKQEFLVDNKLFPKSKVKPGKLYIVLRDVKLNCDNCLYDWYKDQKDYMHSVMCLDKDNKKENKYLDLITNIDELKKTNPCPA